MLTDLHQAINVGSRRAALLDPAFPSPERDTSRPYIELFTQRCALSVIELCSFPYRTMLHFLQSYAPFVSEACSTRRGRPLCLPAIFTHFVRYCSGRPFATLLSEATGVFRAAIDMAAAPQRGANPSFATEELGEVVCPYMWVHPGRIGVVREAD